MSSIMEDIPDLVLERILSFCDVPTRRECRGVCSRWKFEIENSGLAIVVDDRNVDLLEFVGRIIIQEANIKYLSCQNEAWLTLTLEDVKTLIFSGYVNHMFISSNLFQGNHWLNLSKLHFYGTSLISQTFNQDMDPKVICTFPNLKELHLVLASGTLTQAVNQLVFAVHTRYIWMPPHQAPDNYAYTMLSERAAKNVLFLLNSIVSYKLKNLMLSLGTHSGFQYTDLFKFVVKHANTLQKLILPSFLMETTVPPEIRDEAKKLKGIQGKLKSVYYSHIHTVPPKSRIWIDLLKSQVHLEEVFLQYSEFPIGCLPPFVTTLFRNNHRTLKYVTIKSEGFERGYGSLELDLKLLAENPCLEVLRFLQRRRGRKAVYHPVSACGQCRSCGCEEGLATVVDDPTLKFVLKNINSLPSTLKVFETTFGTDEEFDGVRFLKKMINLEELKMGFVNRIGIMQQRSQVLEFIRAGRFHRKLNVFDIEFGFSVNSIPDIGGKWESVMRVDGLGEQSLALFEILNPAAADDTKPWWVIDSVYFGGMFPENVFAERFDCGFMLGNDVKTTYMRHYFDAIDKGLCPASVETCQPFDINHFGAKSYVVHGSPEDEICWGGSTRTPVRSMRSSGTDYHKIYNRCHVEQGRSRVVLLAHVAAFSDKMRTGFIDDLYQRRGPDYGRGWNQVTKDVESSAAGIEYQSNADSEPEDEANVADILTQFPGLMSLGTDAAESSTPKPGPRDFDHSTSFILPDGAKPIII